MKKINLSIPKPCHENWEAMTQVEKGKFCAACQKTVIDFTRMNDREIAEFFKKSSASTCGHFYQDQLDRDIEIPWKRIPWVKYFFQFSLPALLVSMKAGAQGKVSVRGDTIAVLSQLQEKLPASDHKSITGKKEIKGKVLNENGNPVAFATIAQKNTSITTVADESGNFRIKISTAENPVLIASSVGFDPIEVKVDGKDVTITMRTAIVEMKPVTVLGYESERRVCIVGGLSVVRRSTYAVTRKSKGPIALVKKAIDTAFKKFSVYPNPVTGSGTVTIKLSRPIEGKIEIVNSAGQIIQSVISSEENNLKQIVRLNNVSAGLYFVRLTDSKTQKFFTEKLVVQ